MHEVDDWKLEVYRAEESAAWPCGNRRFVDYNEAQAFADDAWLRLRELGVESDYLDLPVVVDANTPLPTLWQSDEMGELVPFDPGPVADSNQEDLGPSGLIETATTHRTSDSVYVELRRVMRDGEQLDFDEHTVFHELAHGLAEVSDLHGSEWVGYHLEVVEKLHPECLDALRSGYEAEGVNTHLEG